jgi:hypothetical protein
MGIDHNFQSWLEAEVPAAQQAPAVDPNANQVSAATQQGTPPPEPPQQAEPEDDVENDPKQIMKPEEGRDMDFEQWRHQFFELAVKDDTEEMVSAIEVVRDRQGLEAAQRKFVEDNLNILLYRRDSDVTKIMKQIRKLVKEDLDKTNPGTTLVQHLTATLDTVPLMYNTLLKLSGTFGWKGDLHRKWLAALLGAIQVGGGGNREDLVYSEKEYNINISTRFYTQFGEINLGKWSLLADDPQRYLKEAELSRLQEGSPEEKQVLRRRIVMESIAEKFKTRAFIIHIAEQQGTIFSIGWDLGNSLIDAYTDGKLVVRGKENDDKEAMINDEGEIIPVIDYKILYVKESGDVDDDGRPETEEVSFIERRDSILYLTADLEVIRNASAGMSGIFFKEQPYNGNPSEILTLQRCLPNLSEIIQRQCV